MKNGITLKNRIMLACVSKDPSEIVEIQKYMRFKLNYTYETMCNYWIKVAGISSADFDDLMQVGDRWIDEMSNIPDA